MQAGIRAELTCLIIDIMSSTESRQIAPWFALKMRLRRRGSRNQAGQLPSPSSAVGQGPNVPQAQQVLVGSYQGQIEYLSGRYQKAVCGVWVWPW